MKRGLAVSSCLVGLLAFVASGCTRSDPRSQQPAQTLPQVVKSARVVRDPEVVRRDGNHLVGAASQYLREHAHDPVEWYPWGEEALGLARAENRPIFLSIGYSSCHFCHVMHDEVFVKDDVARLLNAHFVAIKVDREERPDLDSTYMNALSRFSGSTGWPATLFLTPGLDPFFGATYVPHDRFMQVAEQAASLYAAGEGGALSVVPIKDVLSDGALARGTSLATDELMTMAATATSDMDLARGGAKSRTKFPMTPRLSFLLHSARKWDMPALTDALRLTLDAMARGALRDPVSYGFHRYTTDPDWSVPHYEIMLYDVAQLASLYLEAAAALAEPRYRQIGVETLAFLESDMRVAGGGFAASFDADTAGEEGAAWRWSEPELAAVVGAADGAVVSSLLGVGREKVAPSQRKTFAEVSRETGRTEAEVKALWEKARPKLKAARAMVGRRDDKVVASWNGLAMRAFCMGFVATGEARYRDVAASAGDALWATHHEPKGALTRTAGGADAFAADYGDLASAYVLLFSITAEPRWLTRADALLAEARALEAPDGGFFEGRAELGRSVSLDDSVEPSGTAAILGALLRRDTLGPSDKARAPIGRALSKYGNTLRAYKLGASAWLDAALMDAGPSYEIVIAGSASDAALLAAVGAEAMPQWVTPLRVPGDGAPAALLTLLPSLEGKTRGTKSARAFVCDRTSCSAPTSEPAVLREAVLRGWKR